jgi:D-tyrosyl-tRNA(Tyr) deacylase
MRAVVQRTSNASVVVDGNVVGQIAKGLLVLLAVAPDDGAEDVAFMVRKLSGLRIFPDGESLMNRSVRDAGGSFLVVSQFTLYGDVGLVATGPASRMQPQAHMLMQSIAMYAPDCAWQDLTCRRACSAPTWKSTWSTTAPLPSS